MDISVPEDSGRVGPWRATDNTLLFDLPPEGTYAGHWFNFTVLGGPSPLTVNIRNYANSYYAGAWDGYRPFYRVGERWERTAGSRITPEGCAFMVPAADRVDLAWYQPYPLHRYREWLGWVESQAPVRVDNLGCQSLDCVRLGTPGTPTVVVIGRQHPGESVASFFIEGLVSSLLEAATGELAGMPIHVVVVPIVHPAGVVQGRHRLSEELVDYNRSWSSGSEAPAEVERLRQLLNGLARVDLFLDIHGDEETTTCEAYLRRLPARVMTQDGRRRQEIFLAELDAGAGSIRVLDPRSAARSTVRRLVRPSRDYRAPSPGRKQSAADYVSRTHHIPSYTIELAVHRTDPRRAQEIGASVATALTRSMPDRED